VGRELSRRVTSVKWLRLLPLPAGAVWLRLVLELVWIVWTGLVLIAGARAIRPPRVATVG
jgi:hypothetical protein